MQRAFGPDALDIQHIGSSAVPGRAAKPILDLGIAVATEAGADGELFSIREMNLPIFLPGVAEVPAMARIFTETAHDATG